MARTTRAALTAANAIRDQRPRNCTRPPARAPPILSRGNRGDGSQALARETRLRSDAEQHGRKGHQAHATEDRAR